ncbi:hypothetical protein DFH09DRAFT_1183717 [Mycena vulgaris]|nr:hypothetical protein DFH09DRAFT_1183717 [Mycena vulgaris]
MLPGDVLQAGIPTETEQRIQLLKAETEVDCLNTLLFELPFPSDELISRHEDLEREIYSLRVGLAPYKKLPPELLAEIFLFCSTLPAFLPPTPNEPLLALAHVCSAWRQLALQVSELWANISVLLTEEGNDVPRITDIAEQWISRSGTSYPLSITVECTGSYATLVCEKPELVSGFVPLIISHAHRVRHFDLAFPIAALLPLFNLPRGAFPCLETMSLRPLLLLSDMATPETGHAAWHWPSTAVSFDSAPLVREVIYNPIPLFKLAELEAMAGDVMERAMAGADVDAHPFFAPTFPLPWSQLSVISFPFTALTADAWCSILTDCHGLRHFDVAIKPSPSDERRSNSKHLIRLESLHYLSVSAFSGGGDDLVDRLVTPNLNTFVLLGVQFPTSSLMNFQARSNFVLNTFIPVVHIPAEDVERLFQHLCDIKTLIILAVSTEHFPGVFWERVGRSDLLPHLEALLIRPTAAQTPALVDMIEARWEAALTGLGSGVAVGFCDVRPAHLPAINDELRRLEKYAEGGRTVEMLTVC